MNFPEDDPTNRGNRAADCLPPVPPLGAIVPTACGGVIAYVGGAPCINLNGRPVYFCLAVCKADYDRNPQHSCVAAGPHRHEI